MNFGSLDIVWKTVLKVKVYKLGYQTIILMCIFPQKVKIKGGVKKGKVPKEYDVYEDPLYHENVGEAYFNSKRFSNR